MKSIISVLLFVILTGCGQEPVGEPQLARAIVKGVQSADEMLKAFRKAKKNFISDDVKAEALAWVKQHPNIKTVGIDYYLIADELGVNRIAWGQFEATPFFGTPT